MMNNKTINTTVSNPKTKQLGNANMIIIVVVAVVLVGVITYFVFKPEDKLPEPVPTPTPISQPIATPEPPVAIETPEPVEAPLIAEDLPVLEESDSLVKRLVGQYLSEQTQRLMESSNILQKIVLQIDNMAQGKVIYRHSPISAPNTLFSVYDSNGNITMSEASKARFDVYADTLAGIDMDNLLAIYEFFKPLLEEAYAELGYQANEFEPQLKATIAHILDAPEVSANLALTRPTVTYHFSNSRYEKMTMVHKQMVRMGKENTVKIKKVLSEFVNNI